MSHTYATPLELELVPSGRQRQLLLFIYALTGLAIFLLPVSLLLQLLIVVALLLWHAYLHRQSKLCSHIVWQSSNNWLLTTDHQTSKAMLLPETLLSPVLVILLFRLETGQKLSVLVWPDSVDTDAFRRLRVRLRLEAEKLMTST